MKNYTIYTQQSAAPKARPILEGLAKMVGFVPNVFAVMGGTAPALNGFVEVTKQFGASSLTATEREIVHIATSVENGCRYCVAGHTAFANAQKIDDAVIEAVRTRGAIADPKLAALHEFTRAMVVKRGHLDQHELARFRAAGYTEEQVYEVIIGISEKTISNFTSISLDLPLDEAFLPFAWEPDEARIAA
ncbi:MAG: carboxymuconolactone decarboxylase family protein [Ruegeria sp.]